jgi:hypothetical protein
VYTLEHVSIGHDIEPLAVTVGVEIPVAQVRHIPEGVLYTNNFNINKLVYINGIIAFYIDNSCKSSGNNE